MSDTVIHVENIGKKYLIGHQRKAQQYTALRDVITDNVKELGRRFIHSKERRKSLTSEDFWALKDVSFEVKQGDRIGIFGRNGAGKSTLLKVLSRITEPTKGRVRIKGRVASLLEVGTGFHPELTGRENIFLNGAILGMNKSEILRKFDEIVSFSEVEKFLDVPVKRYSSGMYVRLAFAVAAHLEPEVLIIDEVLAVGDIQFQNKCLGKMKDVSGEGRTVLFVSHNMAAIRQLCDSSIVMNRGKVSFSGNVEAGIKHYLESLALKTSVNSMTSPYGITFVDAFVEDEDHLRTQTPFFGKDYRIVLCLKAAPCLSDCAIVVRVFNMLGVLVSSLCSIEEGLDPFVLSNETEIVFDIRQMPLYPGSYRAGVFVHRFRDPITYLKVESAIRFDVQPAIVQNSAREYRNSHGVFRLAEKSYVRKSLPISTSSANENCIR